MNFTPFPGLVPPHQFLPSSKIGDIQTETNILNQTVCTTASNSLFQESSHNVADYCDKSHGGVFTTAPSHINNGSNSEDRPSEWINPNRSAVQPDRNSFTVPPSHHPNETVGVIWHQKTETQNASTMTDLDTPEDLCKSSAIKESNNICKSSVNGNGVLPHGNWDICSRIHLQRQGNAMALYLARLQPSSLPLSIQQFLNRLNIKQEKDNVFKQKPKNRDFKPRNSEIIVSTNLDGSTLYCCPECRMAYPEKDRLEAHMAVHKSERRFECNVCGACLKRKEHLDQHKRRHSEERPYVCEICCKGFKRNEHLRRHFIIHSGSKMYACPECGKAFSRKDHLNKHAQTHITKRIQPDGVGVSMIKLDNAD